MWGARPAATSGTTIVATGPFLGNWCFFYYFIFILFFFKEKFIFYFYKKCVFLCFFVFFDDFSCFLGVFRGVGGVVQKGSKTVKNGLKWSKTVKNRGFRGPKPEKTRDTLLPINTILREIRPPPLGGGLR